WLVSTNRSLSLARTITLFDRSLPCGIALAPDGTNAYVCLSLSNSLAVVDLKLGTVKRQINVGIAPWDVVLSKDGTTAYVSDWGGRRARVGDRTAPAATAQIQVVV